MRLVLLFTSLAACILPSVYSHTYLVSPKPRNFAAYQNNPVQIGDVKKYPYINQNTNNPQFPSFNTIGWCGSPPASQNAGPIFPSSNVNNFPAPAPTVVTNNTFVAGGLINVYWYHALFHDDPNLGTSAAPIFKYGVRVALNYSTTDMVLLNVHTGTTPTQSTNGIVNSHIEQGTGYDPQAMIANGWVPNATFVLPNRPCDACVLQFWLDAFSDGGGYVDCADIKIQPAATPAATPIPTTPSTTPAPGNPTPASPTGPTNPSTPTTPAPGIPTTPAPAIPSSSSTGGLPTGSASIVTSNVALVVMSTVMSWFWL